MTTRVIAETMLKAWGLWWITAAVVNGVTAATSWVDRSEWGRTYFDSVMLSALSSLFIGLVLLIWGRRIATALFPDTPPLSTQISYEQLSALLFAAVGVYLAVFAIRNVAFTAVQAVVTPGVNMENAGGLFWQPEVYSGLVQFAIGTFLVVRRHGFANAWVALQKRREL